MRALIRTSALALAALAMVAAPLESEAGPGGRGGYHYGHRGYHGGHGYFWGGIGLGLGLGLGTYYALAPWPYYPYYYPDYVVAVPTPGYYDPGIAPAQPAAKAPPEPIVYPNRGQSGAQTEADRQACNRWAMTQPSAVADASVFQRATLACLEGRGYTVK